MSLLLEKVSRYLMIGQTSRAFDANNLTYDRDNTYWKIEIILTGRMKKI
jgi:hypothetical protein